MRRRDDRPQVEPPARLRCYDAAEWLPLVDLDGYDPDRYRNRGPEGFRGEPTFSAHDWRDLEAHQLWARARYAWVKLHGWPGGLTVLDLIRAEVGVRRASVRRRGIDLSGDSG